MHAYRQSKRAIAALCAVLLLISLLPVRTAGAEAAVTHVLSAALKGDASDWAYVEQPVTGITTNTDYSFGVWIKGSGIVTIKASANGTTLAYKRAAASTDWTYESVSFNSGAKSGTVTFSIVDSAATAFPQSETAGQMYLNDAYFGLAASGPNLLQNGGFEDGLGGWNKYVKNVFAVVEEADSPAEPPVDTTVYSGKYALQANLLGQASNWAYLTQQIGGIVSGNVYEMGVWVKGSGAATFKISKGSGSSTAVKFVRQLATGDWTYWTADYTATSNDNLYLSVYDSAAASGSGITQAQAAGTMYMDDLFFRRERNGGQPGAKSRLRVGSDGLDGGKHRLAGRLLRDGGGSLKTDRAIRRLRQPGPRPRPRRQRQRQRQRQPRARRLRRPRRRIRTIRTIFIAATGRCRPLR
ncbi:carbohydrate binding domain-containing protein [Cohnella rhizosphaerae]|uniref:Carbohydrate binding domain-containing protein n=1 Tax=Cohnella rhizosphaerae TaxID=1457232 RepID=A0A9X4QSN4_9BACL|nr:carbohydrate binding domain-containing protein [Cohnella rhizosphaerae]MDG0808752.1 carbohydrate binding domain-containing protein [Cohnella rhizosphaerae]